MFETVAPEAFRTRARGAAYRSLPVSIATHIVIFAAFLIAPQWRAAFPDQPPRLVRPWSIAAAPAPPPPLPSAAARPTNPGTSAPSPAQSAPPPPALDLAPTVIPDSIPVVPIRAAALSLNAFAALAAPAAADDGGEGAGGGAGGSGGGAAEGKPDGLMGGVMIGDRVHFGRNINLPLYVEKKLFPQYPEDERLRHTEDDVTLRYIIGKDGHVRDVFVLEHPRWPRFEESAVRAIRTWRFRPFKVDGEPHEVEHELVVSFRLE